MKLTRSKLTTSKILFSVLLALFAFTGCHNPQPGPDKTLAGAVLGAGWGAGAGAVIGNQLTSSGQGAAVGAGFGAVSGALSGGAYDLTEETQDRNEKELASLRIQNMANGQVLANLQAKLDQAIASSLGGGVYQVFFDPDSSTLKAGSIANLEVIAESIKSDPHAYVVNVVGHADDAGTPDYNKRLAEARARAVSAYLGSRGISLGQIKVTSFGSQRPLVSNNTEPGRQLNRRADVFIGKVG